MLQRIRDKSSGPFAYAVVGLISLVFGVWGIGSYFSQSPNPAVASVGGKDISKYALQRAYDQHYRRLRQLQGKYFDTGHFKPQQFRRTVLEDMIQHSLLQQYAQDSGFRVTDKQLLDKLKSEAAFQVDGNFSASRYQALLAQAGRTTASFEAHLRGDLQIRQLRSAVLQTAFVSDREVSRAYRLAHQQRQVGYLRFAPTDYRGRVQVSDADIKTYYNKHPQAFQSAEQIKVAYVALDRDNLDVSKKPDPAFLKTLYNQQKKSRFEIPARRKARHILVRIGQGTDNAAARHEILMLADKLKNGADFTALARKYSDDKSTADKGGELGWITRGTMAAPFEKSLFKLEPGQVSAPVKTDFGWHLIKLQKIDPAKIKPFEDPDVQAELLGLYRSQERDQLYRQDSERLDALSFQAPESLQPIAKKVHLKIRQSDWFTRAGSDNGIASNKDVVKAAFSDSVLKDRLNSTPIQLTGEREVVLRIAGRKPAAQKPLDTVHDAIKARLVKQRAAAIARKKAKDALKAAQGGGKTLAAIAGTGSATVHDSGWVERDDAKLDSGLIHAAFALPQPGKNAASYGLAELGDASVAVVRVAGLRAPKIKSADAADSKKLRRQLHDRIAGEEYAALRASLRQDYDVKINGGQLQ